MFKSKVISSTQTFIHSKMVSSNWIEVIDRSMRHLSSVLKFFILIFISIQANIATRSDDESNRRFESRGALLMETVIAYVVTTTEAFRRHNNYCCLVSFCHNRSKADALFHASFR